jgi:REP element-mobilizing transposase RayT
MHRGARRAPIFVVEEHCGLFVSLVERVTERYELEVHAYALMPNHYHLLVRSRRGNLSEAMRHLNGSYTREVNRLHRWDGPVFRGRFRSQFVDNEASLPVILAYIHLNPLRANLVTRVDGDCWTSHRAYLGRAYAPKWVTCDYFLNLFGDGAALQKYILDLHRGKVEWPEEFSLREGWMQRSEKVAARHGQPSFGSKFKEPREVLGLVAKICCLPRSSLLKAAKGRGANAPRRFAVWALRESTMLTQREIGKALSMTIRQVESVVARIDVRKEPMRSWVEELSRRVENES